MSTTDIGLVGLAVMGQNLALNIADHGYTIAVYNRSPEKTNEFMAHCAAHEPAHERLIGFADIGAFVQSIKRPRKIILLVKAGAATDATIEALLPHLEKDDIMAVNYQKYVDMVLSKGEEEATKNKKKITESYNAIAAHYANTDKAKAKEYFNKTLALDPADSYATESLKILK